MATRWKSTQIHIKSFLLAEMALYLTFLFLDVRAESGNLPGWGYDLSNGLKYISVLLCFLWRLGKKDKRLLAAQAFVLGADFFLLFTGYGALGICGFLGVQLCYRMYLRGVKSWRWYVLQCVLTGTAAFGILRFGSLSGTGQEAADVLAVVYAAALVFHTVLAFGERRKQYAFFLGLLLLLLCDIHVALYNLPALPGPFLTVWQNLASTAMWLFYLPSQVLVALCAAGFQAGGDGGKQKGN